MQYNIVGINTNDKPFSFSFSSTAYEAVDVLNKRLVGNLNPSNDRYCKPSVLLACIQAIMAHTGRQGSLSLDSVHFRVCVKKGIFNQIEWDNDLGN